IGRNASKNNNTGENNVSLGYNALMNNTSGNHNISLGNNSLSNNNNGSFNTSIGNNGLISNNSGNYNTAIGYNAYNSGDYNNSTAIGFNAYISGDNQIRLGNFDITSIGGAVGWSNLSDGRLKENILNNVVGLDFILNLKPVTYNYNFKAIDPKSQNNNIRYSGFIAQEVEQTAKKVNYDFSGVDIPKNENDFYSLRYAEFVVPIVKSIQEQQKTIEALKLELELQKQKNEALEKRLKAIEEKLK
ncbi:MAG: tail fiber domain-containing protein, partial [Flavobacterium sp.]|nr:tail fiber domain-containing protein [Flavobacterium sp.]